ncbi:twin-arginine translocation signal domain-containing protein [Vulcanisaeta souniana]|uniref:twin-arginine translocation signal domain-containing protein n=1 Tax=Vulcanisaeta souniana TaxID=164452 RepID=UPI000AE15996|nr:twin-arginine translocation signal domain-containing protein [Vulcanisaeta souniana]
MGMETTTKLTHEETKKGLLITRRDFLKIAGVTAAAVAFLGTVGREAFVFGQIFKESKLAPEEVTSDVVAFTTCYGCLGRCNVEVVISGTTKLPRFITGSIFTRNQGATCDIGATTMLHYLSPAS